MNTTLKRGGFEERLLPMLRGAVEDARTDGGTTRGGKTRGRNPRRRASGIALLAATLAIAVAAALFSGVASGGRQMAAVDGLRALQDPRGVEQELRAQGIDATIVVVPMPTVHHPEGYWQGRWWWMTLDRPEDLSQDEFAHLYAQLGSGGADSSIKIENARVLELPKMSGHITLFVGREVPNDQFNIFSYDRINELSPTGSFYCLGIDPNDPLALGDALHGLGYQIIWLVESQNQGETVSAPPPGTVATWAWFRGPDLVDIRLTPTGPEAAKYQEAEGTFPAGTTPPWAPPCS